MKINHIPNQTISFEKIKKIYPYQKKKILFNMLDYIIRSAVKKKQKKNNINHVTLNKNMITKKTNQNKKNHSNQNIQLIMKTQNKLINIYEEIMNMPI